MYYIVLPTSAETAETSEELPMGSIPADTMAGEVVLVGTAKARPFRNVWMLEAAWSFDTVLVDNYGLYMAHTRSH